MNNAIFGKTMENVRTHIEFELIADNPKILQNRINKVNFKKSVIFNKKLTGVHMLKNKVTLNKPVYVGLAILDYSKLDMINFHYGYIKKTYPGNKSRLLFTDTDSLCYEIKTDDLYKDMQENSERFDLSNYPTNHKLFSNKNKKQLFKMKDELGGKIMTEFVGLRSKMYSYQYNDYNGIREKMTGKGIKKSTLKKLKHSEYKACLQDEIQQYVSFKNLKSDKHIIFTKTINKIEIGRASCRKECRSRWSPYH